MIRTTCPKCGREDAVADYLAALPIMCNACGTRVTIGEPIVTRPALPPPVAPPPKPPPVVVAPPLPPPPKLSPPPPPPKAVVPPPPPPKPKPVPPPPPPVVPPPVSVPVTVPDELVMALDEVVPEPVQLVPAPRAVKRPPQFPASLDRPFPLPLAPVWRRILARFLMLLGLAFMAGLGFGVLILVPKSITRDVYITYAIVAAFPVIYLLVNAAMLARTGQDVGKRYAGIRIVNADGSKATEKTALIKRDALTLVLGLTGVGLIYWLVSAAMLFSKGGRTLHDRVAGTRVVRA